MDKKLNYYKWGLSLVSIFSILLISLSVFTSGFRNWDVKTWFDKNNSLDLVKPNNDILSLDFNNSTHVKLTAGETVVSENSISKSLEAFVYPEDAPNKEVDWSIDWQENDKRKEENVSDYITITPSSDGSLKATVTAYKGFEDSSFLITVTTRVGNYSASCFVTYDGAPNKFYIEHEGVEYRGLNETIILNGGQTYNFNLQLSNILNDVGSKYSEFVILDTKIYGRFYIHTDNIKNYSVISSKDYLINFDVNNYSATYPALFFENDVYESDMLLTIDNFIQFSITNNMLTVKALRNEKGYEMNKGVSVSYGTKAEYKSPYVSDSGKESDVYFVIVIREWQSGEELALRFDIVNSVNSVSLDNNSLVF